MIIKKILAGIITAAMLAAAAVSANAAAETESPGYKSFSGTVTRVAYPMDANLLTTDAPTYVYVENKDGGELTFLVYRGSTYWITENKNNQIEIGADFTGIYYYDPKAPMLLIYPPQYKAEAIAVNLPEGQNIKMDRFDEDFIDSENTIQLKIPDVSTVLGFMTEIIYEDGKIFKGEPTDLINRKLLVCYGVTTRSLPGITVPIKIIIFYEKAVPPIAVLTDEDRKMINQALDDAVIQVNGKEIKNKAFISGKGYVMVPVREIAEAMGYHVEWFGESRAVQIGRSLSFTLDKDAYAYNRMAPLSLGEAPVLYNSLTYVPVEFFISPDLGPVSAGYTSRFDEDSDVQIINIIFEQE